MQIPYYKVLAKNKDMTIKPTFFNNKDLILQNEYRRVEKNFNHLTDLSFYTSALSNDDQTSKSHFFQIQNLIYLMNILKFLI